MSLVIEVVRGGFVESRHRIAVAVSDAHGVLRWAAGDPRLRTFWRSAAKPFQAMPLIEDGVARRFGLTPEHLALAAASHSSEAEHLAVTDEFLRRIGCGESDLRCGPHPPLDPDVAKAARAAGRIPTPRWSNCSGKHTGMLALAKHHGWPTAEYTARDHPVQRRLLDAIVAWTGRRPEEIGLAVDGCTTVCYHLDLAGMALAYARLGVATDPAGTAIRQAMLDHPTLVAGTGRFDTQVMQALAGRIIVKVGAEGVYCAALVREGLGVALKVEDGEMRAAAPALAAVLERLLGAEWPGERFAPWQEPVIRNTRDEVVGGVRAAGGLQCLDPSGGNPMRTFA